MVPVSKVGNHGHSMREGSFMRVKMDDGVALEVTDTGSGPALLLVHGFGGAKEDFADHVDALAARHRVVTLDLRGHGESDGPSAIAAYSLDRMAADVLGVADALGIDTFRLLGHSMGGMVARRVVLAQPARLDALVLMDTSPGRIAHIDPDAMEAGATVMLDEGKAVLKPLLDAAATLATPAYERLLADRPGFQDYEDRKWEVLAPAMWAAMAREMARQPDQLALLAGVRCPTLVIVGEQDESFVEGSRQMAATIPGAELVVVPDAGHSPQFENPRPWLEAIERFLASVERATAA
jgi:3-oxoadipate enol-lactonase